MKILYIERPVTGEATHWPGYISHEDAKCDITPIRSIRPRSYYSHPGVGLYSVMTDDAYNLITGANTTVANAWGEYAP